ncbi:MAG: hypothetical protein ACFBSG_20870 [Leptolyngbyaceae cyanobacterium]
MPALLLGSLTATLTLLMPALPVAMTTDVTVPQFTENNLVSGRYVHRRYTGGTGRREILS